ncbi:unnamed protein product [Porites evermanni]|uniref:Uncharacterized protein n=1 Tax=Porites evermanni TaxID=104178 RepID=A0ABN8LFP0_9CNID|nr:unnamed protein product [Porites evermanni]
MQGKTCSILLCALIFLWSTQVIYGYTGPYIHGNNQGKRKRGDIMQKDKILNGVLLVCEAARIMGCENLRPEETMREER